MGEVGGSGLCRVSSGRIQTCLASKARLPVMESVIVKGLTGLETECHTLCQLLKVAHVSGP